MKPVKIFIEAGPITETKISGIGHMTLELVRALSRHPDNGRSFELILVVPFDKKNTLDRWNFEKLKYKTALIPMRLFNIIWKYDLLPPMDLFFGRGIYIFSNYKNWRLAFSTNATFVCDVSYLLYPEFVSPKNQNFLEKNIYKWVKRSDRVLAISENARQEIIKTLGVASEKTLLVPCGVDPSQFFKRDIDEVAAFKRDYGIKGGYILYLGNIEPRKNIERLVDAYKLLPKELRKKYSLVLVGGGGWLDEPIKEKIYQEQKNGLSIIKLNKYVPDDKLPALYSGAEILVHPALYEGFGISPLQAMACETPVVVANNSSLPEVVGSAGLMVEALNVKDISAKMERLLIDRKLRKALISKGKTQAQVYNWENSANIIVSNLIGEYHAK